MPGFADAWVFEAGFSRLRGFLRPGFVFRGSLAAAAALCCAYEREVEWFGDCGSVDGGAEEDDTDECPVADEPGADEPGVGARRAAIWADSRRRIPC